MATRSSFETTLRASRERKGWSQEELARHSGLSRAGISAIEIGRLVPSAAAALALAGALGCRVEDLFRLHRDAPGDVAWAWPPRGEPCRYWEAEVGGVRRLYPAEATLAGMLPHDGVYAGGPLPGPGHGGAEASNTLVMAGCDPAAGLLAAELAGTSDVRLLPLLRSSRAALAMLRDGLVHVAGVHLAATDDPGGNAAAVRETIGPGYNLLRLARWDEGIVFAPAARLTSVRSALQPGVRWIGREDGSGARRCLDDLRGDRKPPRRLASDHHGVAEAIRHGWADAGVCLRLVGEEAGLGFLSVRREDYDLCVAEGSSGDLRIQALMKAIRSPSYRRAIGELPGYDSRGTGEITRVK